MIPARKPRLMAQRQLTEARAAEEIAHKEAAERAARAKADAIERDRARRRRANHPLARALETAGGWVLTIVGAVLVSLVLTYLVNHPQTLNSLVASLKAFLHIA